MLKLENQLWIYSPSTDRTIQLSGHLLRQSMMGSDISYEDLMEERKLLDIYNAEVEEDALLEITQLNKKENREVYVLSLLAKVEDVNYHKRKLWVDKRTFLPLQEELYAKSGILLKKLVFGDIEKVDNRWVAKKMIYKDMLKRGKGTEMIIDQIEFDPKLSNRIFSKSSLRR